MKRKIFATILTTALILSLTACGGQEPNADTNSQPAESITTEAPAPTPTTEPTNEPVVEPTSEPIEDNTTNENGVVDSGTIDDVPIVDETYTYDVVRYDYDYFNAWQEFSVLSDNPNMANHVFWFKGNNDIEMHISIIAPNVIKGLVRGNGSSLSVLDGDENYKICMWSSSLDDGEKLEDYDVNTITSLSADTYVEGTYQIESTDEYCRVLFKVFDETTTGYNCYIAYYDTMKIYQFEYSENNAIFDDERALSVVQSIERVKVTE